jgi:ABC-type cobalamin/Fe3+-siderophores transport system ATPase subunit
LLACGAPETVLAPEVLREVFRVRSAVLPRLVMELP